tara:strand:- start:9915 stop:11822 length:1908 start_codon:yes stop_codon:yes gene_type:complete
VLKNNYIQYIDGLRAIAVTLVFIFHLSPDFLPGGFIGVDVFFVLSGYLISGIIIERFKNDRFYSNFIIGRVRRLVPAYILVVAVTSVFAWFILLPNELTSFVKSLLAASTFTSNVFFYLSSDYFAGSSEFYPLLHTWSLSVEWQFYLFFPFVLIALLRLRPERMLISLSILFILSAIVALFATQYSPSLAFYNTPFRVSEFLVGTLVYVVFKRRSYQHLHDTKWGSAIGWLSIVSIVIGALWLSKANLFPGIYATVVATITGAILIAGNLSSPCSSWKVLLTFRPIAYLGKISYSFYLWHWPIITFYKLYQQAEFDAIDYIIITFATLVLSDLSWRFVECKFRTNQKHNTKKVGWSFGIACLASAIFLAMTLYTKGFSDRLSERQLNVLNVQRWADFPGKCNATQREDSYYHCVIGNVEQTPRLFVFGDSHAQVLVWSLHKTLQERGESAVIIAKGGCPPFLPGVPVVTNIEKNICEKVQQVAFNIATEGRDQFNTVILAGRWVGYEKVELYGEDFITGNSSVESFEYRLVQSLSTFKGLGFRIVLIDSVPEPGFPVPEWLIRSELLGRKIDGFNAPIHSIAPYVTHLGAVLIDPKKALCDVNACKLLSDDGEVLFFDSNHLTVKGADIVLEKIF